MIKHISIVLLVKMIFVIRMFLADFNKCLFFCSRRYSKYNNMLCFRVVVAKIFRHKNYPAKYRFNLMLE